MSSMTPTVEDGIRAARDERFVNALARCMDDSVALDTTIHPSDQMFLHSLAEHKDTGAALSQYFNIARQQYDAFAQVVAALLPARTDLRILDFACGFGRLLRFLPHRYPVANLWACEIQQDALQFVADSYGVNTVASTEHPRDLEIDARFDVIWVASLFSHLPDHLFRAWLGKLHSMLSEDGILCFSVRPPDSLAADSSGSADFTYSEESELTPLDGGIYGTAFASQAYVDEVVRSTLSGHKAFRIARALANEQDLYVVAWDANKSLAALEGFQHGPWGWLDVKQLDASGQISLQGWAGSMDGGTVALDVRVDGIPRHVRVGIEREDVACAFGDERLRTCGWLVDDKLTAGSSERVWVEIMAKSGRSATLIYAGEVERGSLCRSRE